MDGEDPSAGLEGEVFVRCLDLLSSFESKIRISKKWVGVAIRTLQLVVAYRPLVVSDRCLPDVLL
jgi:hypothetical protein